jgi:SAM-dependent methyltransferase
VSAEPIAAPAAGAPPRQPFAGRALHALPDEARLLPAALLYGRLLAGAARHARVGGPTPEGRLRRADGRVEPLPLARWLAPVDAADAALLARVEGPVLDIGCGPGRHVAALTATGRPGLGIDLSPVAVEITRGRGGDAILGSVFDHVPDAGTWGTALLLDGNIGIGGRAAALLRRARELLAPGGAVLTELDPPGAWTGVTRVRLEAPGVVSEWFPWAHVAADRAREVAADAGLAPAWTLEAGGRWFAALRRP